MYIQIVVASQLSVMAPLPLICSGPAYM